MLLYRGADKSLAQPEEKQATATKLLSLQATQKHFRMLSVQPGLRGSNDLRVGRKMATFPLFFQSGRSNDLISTSVRVLYVYLHLHWLVPLVHSRIWTIANILDFWQRSYFRVLR